MCVCAYMMWVYHIRVYDAGVSYMMWVCTCVDFTCVMYIVKYVGDHMR